MENKKNREAYNTYFPDDSSKAKAFDEIAERYYMGNFGSLSKTDLETLLFSIYIEQILDKHEEDMAQYSDYTLSKLLGITQAKVSALKVRKELVYPYQNFNWEASFKRVSGNAVYENGKIKVHIPDRNVYLELKNKVEEAGGYIDVQLNQNLLQIRPEYFLDLLVAISEDKEDTRAKIKKACK